MANKIRNQIYFKFRYDFNPISYYLVKQKLSFNFIYFSIALCRPPLLGRPIESKIWPQIPSLFSC